MTFRAGQRVFVKQSFAPEIVGTYQTIRVNKDDRDDFFNYTGYKRTEIGFIDDRGMEWFNVGDYNVKACDIEPASKLHEVLK